MHSLSINNKKFIAEFAITAGFIAIAPEIGVMGYLAAQAFKTLLSVAEKKEWKWPSMMSTGSAVIGGKIAVVAFLFNRTINQNSLVFSKIDLIQILGVSAVDVILNALFSKFIFEKRRQNWSQVIASDNQEAIRRFVHVDINTELWCPDKTTLLHDAVRKKKYEITELLIAANANVNAEDRFGISPLRIVIDNTDSEDFRMVNLLIKNNADVNHLNFKHESLLHFEEKYLKEGVNINCKLAELLITANANVNTEDMNGKSPIFKACDHLNLELVQLLIENNVGMNSRISKEFCLKNIIEHSLDPLFSHLNLIPRVSQIAISLLAYGAPISDIDPKIQEFINTIEEKVGMRRKMILQRESQKMQPVIEELNRLLTIPYLTDIVISYASPAFGLIIKAIETAKKDQAF